MEDLKETFTLGLKQKGISARQMLIHLDIVEPTYYSWLRANSMPTSEYKRICDYLGLEIKVGIHTSENDTTIEKISINFNDFISQLHDEIKTLKFDNFTLRRQLGKFEGVLCA